MGWNQVVLSWLECFASSSFYLYLFVISCQPTCIIYLIWILILHIFFCITIRCLPYHYAMDPKTYSVPQLKVIKRDAVALLARHRQTHYVNSKYTLHAYFKEFHERKLFLGDRIRSGCVCSCLSCSFALCVSLTASSFLFLCKLRKIVWKLKIGSTLIYSKLTFFGILWQIHYLFLFISH